MINAASAFTCPAGRLVAARRLPRRCQTLVVAVERPRRVEVRPFPSNRRLVTAAMRAGRSKMPMYGLVGVDVTTANRLLAGHDPPWSLTAFVVASVARAAAAASSATRRPAAVAGGWSGRGRPRPGSRAWSRPYAVMARSVAARQRIGTVAVTAVGVFAGGGGFGITSLTLMSLEVIVGGMSQRPRVIDGQVTVRDVLDLTVVIDHNVVDGAPAARFAAEFRGLLESAAVISPSSVA
jgi:2-oxoacid dehydrogenases acyltransferase (catalytic domain)